MNLLNRTALLLVERNLEKAKSYAELSINLSKQLNYQLGKATALRTLGLTYQMTEKHTALEYYEKALVIFKQINDSNGICNALLTISNVTKEMGDMKTSEESLKKALKLASTLNSPELYLKTLYNTALNLSTKGNYTAALDSLLKTVELSNKTGNHIMMAKSYSSLGIISNIQGNFPKGLEYFYMSLHIYEKENDWKGACSTLINIAGISSEQDENETALSTINQALQLAKKNNNPEMASICLTNIGYIYKKMEDPRALQYLRDALQLVRGKKAGQTVNLLSNIGTILIEQKQYEEALSVLNEALDIAQKTNIKFAQGAIWQNLGTLSHAQKHYAQAISYANKALQIGNEIKFQKLKKDCYQLLAETYAITKDYQKAYTNHVLFKQMHDSLFNEKNIRKTAILENIYKHEKEIQKYEVEKLNQQIELDKQHRIIIFVITITLLVIILLYQRYHSSLLKKKLLAMELEKTASLLQDSQKATTSATLKLMQHSESDLYCMKLLENIKNDNNETVENIQSLINHYKSKSLNSNWEEFETLFLKVNSDFYTKLNSHFPTLTPNELKLCVFLKLNMTNKDIAQITLKSEDALKKARLRLRKKMQLDRTVNLTSFIQSIS
ncbi:tetratricopeptide repeat protein [Bacteroides cellulosilyticus]|uniref:tetratricopeptide repeat protein n=1 Tax=Bacteroides cellulosilyticus TaxID=246787 RepID=UPI0032C1D402